MYKVIKLLTSLIKWFLPWVFENVSSNKWLALDSFAFKRGEKSKKKEKHLFSQFYAVINSWFDAYVRMDWEDGRGQNCMAGQKVL